MIKHTLPGYGPRFEFIGRPVPNTFHISWASRLYSWLYRPYRNGQRKLQILFKRKWQITIKPVVFASSKKKVIQSVTNQEGCIIGIHPVRFVVRLLG